MAPSQLTPTSYIVLGFVEMAGEATPYQLTQRLGVSAGNFWSVPRSQVYAESERLAATAHLEEHRERAGRRRRIYRLTEKGSAALDLWRRTRSRTLPELRDPGLLQIFFGAEPGALAPSRIKQHREKLAEYEALLRSDSGDGPSGPRRALRAGLLHERASIQFWTEVAEDVEEAG